MEPCYNLNYLTQISNGDVDFEKDIINTFLKNVPQDMQRLAEAIKDKNGEKTHYYSHKMKPSFQLLQLSCTENLKYIEIEGKSIDKSWESIEKNYRIIQEIVNAVIDDLGKINS